MDRVSGSEDPVRRAEELRELIEHHNFAYHTLGEPEVSDADFDDLVRELRELEEVHPDLATPDSPTMTVGAAPSELFAPVRHRVPMMSLDNAFSLEDLLAWGKRLERLVSEPFSLVCELKIDGVAMSVRFEDGRYV